MFSLFDLVIFFIAGTVVATLVFNVLTEMAIRNDELDLEERCAKRHTKEAFAKMMKDIDLKSGN